MSDMSSFRPTDTEQDQGKSNVFLDLNKPDDTTGVPAITQGLNSDPSGGVPGQANSLSEPSKFNGQVILAGLVFAIGAGAIYTMRHIGMQAGIKESVSLVEYTPSTNTPDFIKRFDSIMEDLEEVSISVQFSTDTELPKSPFTLETTSPTKAAPAQDDSKAAMARLAKLRKQMEREEQEAKEAEYDMIASGLTLQSVIGGSRPVARISGEPVGVGMMVADTFKVLSIQGPVVILQVEGIKYQLGLGTGAMRINE